ncbi:MAG: hypothetical protein ACRDQZ_20585, partial [Mycobacteriales bacterium]
CKSAFTRRGDEPRENFGRRQCCSKACARQKQQASYAAHGKKSLRCEFCGIEFVPREKTYRFCSASCSSESRRVPPETRQCEYCGGDFERRVSTSRFCSQACWGYMRRGSTRTSLPAAE